jgi:hypothetical protein
MEIQIKQIQAALLELEVVETITQSEQSIEPTETIVEEKSNEEVLKAIKHFNNLFKK